MNEKELYKECHRLFRYEDGKLIRKVYQSSRAKKDDIAGCSAVKGYRLLSVNYQRILEHRIIFLMVHGYMPKMIDHIDRNRSNNKIENLRPCTLSQNGFNSQNKIGGTSKYKGDNWLKANKKWRARIKVNKKEIHLGLFDTPLEGAKAYDKYVMDNLDEFAVTNKSLGLY